MRAHTVLRGLLEVELDRAPVEADAEAQPEPVPVGPARPHPGQVELLRIAELEQLGEAEVGRHHGLLGDRRDGQP